MVLITIFGNQGEHSTFTVSQGQMFFVPSGYLHHIENLNQPNASVTTELIIALSSEAPEEFDFSTAFGAMYNILTIVLSNKLFYFFIGQILYLVILINYPLLHGKVF
jgi:hypothetical protein